MQLYSLLGFIFALLVAIFAVQNTSLVEINFIIWKFRHISLVLVILGSAAFGALFVFLLGLVSQIRLGREIWQLKSENKRLQDTINELKQSEELENEGKQEV
ncbi:MAG: hypothetical protein PWP31_123 [Clostridia bacterium]|nr:hypothetical protein [Clostridia bacterium]